MKILHRDLKHGIVKVKVENLDDLWYLSQIVQPGDLVRGHTVRRVKSSDDRLRSESERVSVSITVKTEKTEFRSDSDTLRISGTITEGPEDVVAVGSHHTFNVEPDTILSVKKEKWLGSEIDCLKNAEETALKPRVMVVVIDEGEVTLGLVRESAIKYYEMSKVIGGKDEPKGRDSRKIDFYTESAGFISGLNQQEKISAIIIAGTGFEKDNFHRFLSEKYPELAEISTVENIGSHGRTGVQEVLKRKAVNKVVEKLTIARDAQLMEKLLEHVGRDSGLGVYGFNDVLNAISFGAVETLLLTDSFFLNNREKIEEPMQRVKNSRGFVHILNHETEAGQKLDALGGIAAILRFKIR